MFRQGRVSASAGFAIIVAVVFFMVLHEQVAEAAPTTYTVGGAGGWTFNVASWPKGKRFKAGDTLVFNYSPGIHNVVAVNKAGYQSCSTSRGAKNFRTGKDKIKLGKGQSYFICTIPGHCGGGMKIAINAV